MSRRALIIGGSLGGLFAAHTLRSIGWEADVFERVPDDLASRGAGLGTHEGLFDVARRIGIAFDHSKGVAIDAYVCLDRAGRVIHETPMPRVMTAWSQIYRPLRDVLPTQVDLPPGNGRGIHSFRVNRETGAMTPAGSQISAIRANPRRSGPQP